jgi:DNA-directed RNA polymerase specialized sigma24 family protein
LKPENRSLESIQRRRSELMRIAARFSRNPNEAEDLLQDALLEAAHAGRLDLDTDAHLPWLIGVLRNLGTMTARGAARRRIRESVWVAERPQDESLPWWKADDREHMGLPKDLAPSLARVAQLALSGHDRHEIAWLLGLSDTAMRQRICALRKQLKLDAKAMESTSVSASNSEISTEMQVPIPLQRQNLLFGLLRRALLPVVRHQEGMGTSDPDGHLLVVTAKKVHLSPPTRLTFGDPAAT